MKDLRPQLDQAVRKLVERAVDVPEPGGKIIGERSKGSGMRWVGDGAATVAALRSRYGSGGQLGDGFWSQPCRSAA